MCRARWGVAWSGSTVVAVRPGALRAPPKSDRLLPVPRTLCSPSDTAALRSVRRHSRPPHLPSHGLIAPRPPPAPPAPRSRITSTDPPGPFLVSLVPPGSPGACVGASAALLFARAVPCRAPRARRAAAAAPSCALPVHRVAPELAPSDTRPVRRCWPLARLVRRLGCCRSRGAQRNISPAWAAASAAGASSARPRSSSSSPPPPCPVAAPPPLRAPAARGLPPSPRCRARAKPRALRSRPRLLAPNTARTSAPSPRRGAR